MNAPLRERLTYGNVPVPYAALWSGEAGQYHVAVCPHVGRPAVCDVSQRGTGKPIFGKPHMGRQREVVANDLCDLCARPLAKRTKVSLSHAAVTCTGANGPTVMQVEPMLHKECAAICLKHCPSLIRDIERGTLFVRQVTRHHHEFAVLTEDAAEEFTGTRTPGLVGHAKVALDRWVDRDINWLERS